jgi:ribosome biogenesis GTPase
MHESVLLQIELLCKARSLIYKMGGYVLVGDRVEVMNIDWRDARALVSEVKPRTTEIMSPKAANVDHFALVFSIADPPFEAFQATRFLVSASSIGIECSLILNKCDLVPEEDVDAQLERVRSWGYSAVAASVRSGRGMQQVRSCSLCLIRALLRTTLFQACACMLFHAA